jgi:hypothetical protein
VNEYLSPVSLTPAINYSAMSTTPAKNLSPVSTTLGINYLAVSMTPAIKGAKV